jgi:glycosyltransferase involved in cell wall biosynthesis
MGRINVLHIARNEILNDIRVTKEVETLSDKFDGVQFTALGHSKDKVIKFRCRENLEIIQIRRFFKANKIYLKILNYFIWVLDAVKIGKGYHPLVVHCHDIDALLVGVILKLTERCQLIFDAHELQSEQWDNTQRPFTKRILVRFAELLLMPHVDHLITVSQSILDWYKARHPRINGAVVRNIPKVLFGRSGARSLRDDLNIPSDALLFIYLGVLDASRGLQSILNCFTSLNVKHHIVFMGSGEFAADIKNAEVIKSNVHYHPPVPPSEVVSVAASADIGICLIPGSCLNYEFCLPNKVFEYILSGLPVVASNLTEVSLLLEKYHAGWIVNDEVSLQHFVRTLSAEKLKLMSDGLRERTRELSWDNEATGLITAYDTVLRRSQ